MEPDGADPCPQFTDLLNAYDQLRADKAELLAALKSNIMHGSEAYHDRVEAEAHRIIAKHEERK